MKKNKNSFYVALVIPLVMLVMALIGAICFGCVVANSFYEDIWLSFGILAGLVLLPTGTFIWLAFAFFPKIKVDNEGFTKYLFGIKIKTIYWNEIICIKNNFNGTYGQWLFFSKSNIERYSLSRCRLRRDNIYFYVTFEKIKIVENNAPDFIIEKLKALSMK